MYSKILKLFLLSYGLLGLAFAQEALQLEEAIAQMKQNNTQLKLADSEISLSQAELSGTNAAFLPKIAASYTGYITNDPLNAFGFKLQQGIVSQLDFDPQLLNNPDATSDFHTNLSVHMPILNFDVFSAKKALKEKIKATEYKKLFATEMLAVEIEKAYINLQFLYEAKTAVKQGIAAYAEVLRNSKNMEKQGYAKYADVLMVQVGLSEVQHKEIDIDNNIANLSDYLNWLMGRTNKTIYKPTVSLVQNQLSSQERSFAENRYDLLAMKSGLNAQQEMINMNKKRRLPRLNGFGSFGFHDKKMFGFGNNGYMAGLSLSWDIFNGNETLNKDRQLKISQESMQTEIRLHVEKNQLELEKANRDLIANNAKIQLAKSAKEQASESLQILENRYAQGLEKTSDVLVSQATAISKQVNFLEAVKDFNLSALKIRFLTQQTN